MIPGVTARIHQHQGSWCVMVATKPEDAVPDALLRKGTVGTMLTHDRGVSWPDRQGEQLGRAILEQGGVVFMGFESMADALTCKGRLDREFGKPGS